MPAEGMVHALEKIHELLAPDGFLIDIHPVTGEPRIEVHIDDRIWVVGDLVSTPGFAKYVNADQALETVVQRGLFTVERQGLFTFLNYADDPDEYVEYITTEWTNWVLEEDVIQRMRGFFDVPGEGKAIVMREATHIIRLRPGDMQA